MNVLQLLQWHLISLKFLPLSPISQVIYEVLSNDDFILIFNILFRYRKWLVTFLWAHTLVSGSTVGYFFKYLMPTFSLILWKPFEYLEGSKSITARIDRSIVCFLQKRQTDLTTQNNIFLLPRTIFISQNFMDGLHFMLR